MIRPLVQQKEVFVKGSHAKKNDATQEDQIELPEDESDCDKTLSIDEDDLTIDLIGDNLDLATLRHFKKCLDKFKKLAKGGMLLGRNPITITICTSGGDYRVGLAINNLLVTSKLPITTVALGEVASAGLAIFLAGTKRLAYRSALFYFHKTQPLTEPFHSREELELTLLEEETVDELYVKLLPKDCSLSAAQQRKFDRASKLMTADEALGYGLVHKII